MRVPPNHTRPSASGRFLLMPTSNKFPAAAVPGKMASLWLSPLVVLLSVVMVGSYKLPSLWLLIRDGSCGEDASRLPAATDSQRQWQWKASVDEGHEHSLSPRRKRGSGVVLQNSSIATKQPPKNVRTTPGTSITPETTFKGKIPEPSHATAAPKKVAAVTPSVGIPPSTPKINAPSRPPGVSLKHGGAYAGNKRPEDIHHFVTKPVRVGKGTAGVAFSEMGKVLTTTEHWPWLEDLSSPRAQTLVAGTAVLKRGWATTVPGLIPKGKPVSSLETASPTSDWRQLDEMSTASSRTLVDNSDVSTATVDLGLTTARPNFKAKDDVSLDRAKVGPTTLWPWLDEMSTATSQTLVDISDASTAMERRGFGTVRPSLRAKGKDGSSLRTTVASPTTALTGPAGGTAGVVGKCVLALFLLALVAAIFIVTSAVLAAMLWRQKLTYKTNRCNHTEMVCISSLLATEEAEESRERPPTVKRVKMLRENGSETEMDNLTLNSFLPEH